MGTHLGESSSSLLPRNQISQGKYLNYYAIDQKICMTSSYSTLVYIEISVAICQLDSLSVELDAHILVLTMTVVRLPTEWMGNSIFLSPFEISGSEQ